MRGQQVDIYYIHAADPTLDLADMLSGINDAHKAGYFERFGLSNYTPPDVQRVYDICKEKSYPLPTVYQGSYSPVGRKPEQVRCATPSPRRIHDFTYNLHTQPLTRVAIP
jgi:aflatoxin B1 aldehyde reductase